MKMKVIQFLMLQIFVWVGVDAYGINSIFTTLSNFVDGKSEAESSDNFDFVIIGSGSAGSVIANRLSEGGKWKILLLEAGRPGNILTDIPIFAPIFQITPYNWNYTMEKQDGICLGMEDNLCAWPRGKALGGSTIINYMIYTRGNPLDFEKWTEKGITGWSYKEVLPYYLKSEHCNLKDKCLSNYHRRGGYLNVEDPFSSEITETFLRSGVETGHKLVDYNSADFFGFSKIQANLKRGRRVSAASAFINPFLDRRNLHILLSARVTKILINPQTKTAYGVEFYFKKKKYIVRVKKEVILSAGAFHSPQLLMLSGVGPEEHLKEKNIPVIKNLPVGQTMYDHLAYLGLVYKMNVSIEDGRVLFLPESVLNYLFKGKGPYTSLGGVEALAYIKTNVSQDERNYPDIELILSGIGSFQSDYGLISRPELRIKKEIYNRVFKPLENEPCWSIIPMLLHPKSKGSVKLRSNNPFDSPLLYGSYYTDPDNMDMLTMINAIRYIQNLASTNAFQKLGSTIHDIPIPGCEQHPFDSDSYWECCLRTLTVTLHHQIATCKMGTKDDPEAVVDHKLRVHGVKNLRVADTSVIPETLSAHTSAPTMMIGEKVSDIIKADWNFNKE